MPYIVIAMIAALVLSYGAAANAQGRNAYILGLGYDSCGKYLSAVHGHPPGKGKFINRTEGQFSDDHFRYSDWLSGFFSATNMWITHEPNGIRNDVAAIDVWIRKWCEQNPAKDLADAAWAYVWDQHQEYLQAWFARQSRK